MKRKLTILLIAALTAVSVAGCGKKQAETKKTDTASAQTAETSSTASETPAADQGKEEPSSSENETLKLIANPGIHEDILNEAAPLLKEEGIDLEVEIASDYTYPNVYVDGGYADANFFQHTAFMKEYNLVMEGDIVAVGTVHFEPMGIYPAGKKSIDDLAEGDIIAIPGDTTNRGRALKLLEQAGIITLKPGAGDNIELQDIDANPKGVVIEPQEASRVAAMRGSAALLVLNGNYAEDAFYVLSEALVKEDAASEAAQTYANVIAVKSGNENDPRIQKLVEVLQSDEIQNYIATEWSDHAVPCTVEVANE